MYFDMFCFFEFYYVWIFVILNKEMCILSLVYIYFIGILKIIESGL